MKCLLPAIVPVLLLASIVGGCKKSSTEPAPAPAKAEVVINDVPFRTESFLRIPYTLRMWEYEKEGLKLRKITVLDDVTKTELGSLEGDEIPLIHKDPLAPTHLLVQDRITSYYTSIQIPIPLAQQPPARVSHRLLLRDTVNNRDVTWEGAAFTPRYGESPVAIAPPVKGRNWAFFNQSTNGYHFYLLTFLNGTIYSSERFAFDNFRFSDNMTDYLAGDPKVNASYFCYRDTLYAVADGVVQYVQDGRPENHGDAGDAPLPTSEDYAGNVVIINIGGGRYAVYAHCVPQSLFVKVGDTVKEGQPVALLGNAGNSGAPHLHFQVTNGPGLFESQGVTFVWKKWTKIGTAFTGPSAPQSFTNCMNEQWSMMEL